MGSEWLQVRAATSRSLWCCQAFKETMADIARRWRELHAKEDQLKTYMEKSMRRLKEDDKLRVQALKKAMREREQKTQKEMELVRAKKKLEALKKEHQKLSKEVQKYSIFKTYLEDVVKISPQFEDIQDVISRYKLLVRTRKDLQQSQEKDRKMIKQTKVLLDRDEAEKEAETLQYQNELEQLQQRFAQAQSDVRFWTARWADIQNRNTENGLMLTTMKMAIHNLFQCVNTQLKAKVHVPEDDSLRQLDMVEPSQTPLPAQKEEQTGNTKTHQTQQFAGLAALLLHLRAPGVGYRYSGKSQMGCDHLTDMCVSDSDPDRNTIPRPHSNCSN
ncbi:hypothetical protein Q9233_014071 [Columba guinea]|nr:hypothetical protein Q9233_014071 [Columba guinea]